MGIESGFRPAGEPVRVGCVRDSAAAQVDRAEGSRTSLEVDMTAQLYGTKEARAWPIRADGSAPRHHRRRPAMQFVLKTACAGRTRAGTGQPGRSDPRLAHSP